MIGPELRLAIACCRWSWSAPAADEAAQLASEVDWPKFLRLLARHRMQGLAAKSLRKSGISVPQRIGEAITADVVAASALNLRSAVESMRIADVFAAASLPILFVKGLTLSALAYGDPFLKWSADVDVLVEPQRLHAAAELLGRLGYRPTVPAVDIDSDRLSEWHGRLKESVWESPESKVVIELHTRLADNPALIPDIGMSSPSQLVSIGTVGALPTLTTEDLFAYLCVHGSSSAWFRLKWIADLAALLHRVGDAEVERLYVGAAARGAGRAPAQALLLAHRLSLIVLPPALRAEIECDPLNRLLASMAFRVLARESAPTERPLGTALIHLSQPLLAAGIRFKLSELLRQARDVLYRTWGVA